MQENILNNDLLFLKSILKDIGYNVDDNVLLSKHSHSFQISYLIEVLNNHIKYNFLDEIKTYNNEYFIKNIKRYYGNYTYVYVKEKLGIFLYNNYKEDNKKTIWNNIQTKNITYNKINLIDSRAFFNTFSNSSNNDHIRNVRLLKCAHFDSETISFILEISKSQVKKILKEVYGKFSS